MSRLFSTKVRLWLLLLLIVIFGVVPIRAQESADYWPGIVWRESTPEEQGIDSATLLPMFDYIQTSGWKVHSIVVIRNGYRVLEAYFHPYQADISHLMWSVTKSITSTLVGMAIAAGDIQGVDQPVLEFFPEYDLADLDARMEKMQIKHLLTMTSGLNCDDMNWSGTSNWVQAILTEPMVAEPGAQFGYCNQASHLLSAIVERATGVRTVEFAQQHLFEPLDITNYSWETDPQGVASGAWGLQLTPDDMAKIGYLYLHQGQWDGQTIVPESWVDEATRVHSQNENGSHYGYQWWINPGEGFFAAHGLRGQMIGIVPEKNLLVMVTAALGDGQSPDELLKQFVLPSVQSDEALPPNPEAVAALGTAVENLAQPMPTVLPLLTPMGKKISGKTFPVSLNPQMFQALTPKFAAGSATAAFTFVTQNGLVDLIVGLDGVYRVNENLDPPTALRAAWSAEDTLRLEWEWLNGGYKLITLLTFTEDDVQVYPSQE